MDKMDVSVSNISVSFLKLSYLNTYKEEQHYAFVIHCNS